MKEQGYEKNNIEVEKFEVKKLNIGGIPFLIWGRAADKVYIHVHGKMSRKEFAKSFAIVAEEKGCQTLSFDLPEHGERANEHEYRCDIWNGRRDLKLIAGYALEHWRSVCLFGSRLAVNTPLWARETAGSSKIGIGKKYKRSSL